MATATSTNAKAAPKAAAQPQPKAEPEAQAAQPQTPKAEVTRRIAAEENIQVAEELQQYANLGPAYAATGVYGDLSLEVGITSGKPGERQRSGFGFYFRSDHIAHRKVRAIV